MTVDFVLHDGKPTKLFMHQPLPKFGEILTKTAVADVLSLGENDLDEEYPVQIVSCGVPLIFVPLKSLDGVRRTKLRVDLLEALESNVGCKELFVFSRETERPEFDVHCRMFAPRFGIPEDPATGGAHGPLGSYLVKYGILDGTRILSEQGIEMGRPSAIEVRVETLNGEITDLLVGGDCVEVGTGRLRVAHP